MIELNIADSTLFEPFFDAFCEDERIPFKGRFSIIKELTTIGIPLKLLQRIMEKATIDIIVDANHYGIVISHEKKRRLLTYFDYVQPMIQIYGLDGRCVSELINYYSITTLSDGRAWIT